MISWGVTGLVMHNDYYADACADVQDYDIYLKMAYLFDLTYFFQGILLMTPVLASWDYSVDYHGVRLEMHEVIIEVHDF